MDCSKLRYCRIRIEHRSERVFQRTEPMFEMAPVVDALLVDRFADLFGTGGPHRAIVLEETQALLLECKPAIVEQAPYLALGVGDHLFVDDAMDAAGKHGVEVRHQFHVVAVVAADFVEAVAEGLPAREM